MEFLLLPILIISVPIFYLLGLIDFFKTITGKKEKIPNSPKDRLNLLISELKKLNSDQTIGSAIAKFTKDLEAEGQVPSQVVKDKFADQAIPVAKNESLSHWYSDNSINLMLYIGAFLIVASASIFVGFSWETITGVFKATILTILTLSFLLSGFIFYKNSKIQTAGATFIAIGAILIPICFLAWYNFVLGQAGVGIGTVWLIGSVTSSLIYLFLAIYLKNQFYSYALSAGYLSIILSLVNLLGFRSQYYILGGVLSGYLLLISRFFFPKDKQQLFDTQFSISANVITPVSLLLGLVFAVSGNNVISLETSTGLILGSGYYLLYYYLTKKSWSLIAGALILPLGLVNLLLFYKAEDLWIAFLVSLVGAIYLTISSYLYKLTAKKEEADGLMAVGLILVVTGFVSGFFFNLSSLNLAILSIVPVFGGIYAGFVKKEYGFLMLSAIFLVLAEYFLIRDLASNWREILGFTYLVSGGVLYGIAVSFKKNTALRDILGLSVGLFYLLSLGLLTSNDLYLIVVCAVISLTLMLAAFNFEKRELIYVANLGIIVTIFNILRYLTIPTQVYPLVLSVISVVFYLLSLVFTDQLRKIFRFSGLISSLAPMIFVLSLGSSIWSDHSNYHLLEKNMLISSYIASSLFILDAIRAKKLNNYYAASAVAMVTLLWQFKFINITEAQFYILPLGIYCLAIAYTRKTVGDLYGQKMWDFIGLGLLAISTFFQSTSATEGFKYALLLGVEGMAIFISGNFMKRNIYLFAGAIFIILAVVSQSYQYLFSLPRWIITGIGGLVFLITATTLLLKRKQ